MRMQTPDPKLLSRSIKEQARAAGFDKVGIAPAEPLSAEHARLEEWLRRGYHGEMSWMARDPRQRTCPQIIFPEARSVIVVVLNYYTPAQHSENPATGK